MRRRIKVNVLLVIFIVLFLWIILVPKNSPQPERIKKILHKIFSAPDPRNVSEMIMPGIDTTLIRGWKSATENLKSNTIVAVILVASLPESKQRRDLIRSTWGRNVPEHSAILRFFMGRTSDHELMKKLYQEAEVNQDVIVDNFEENASSQTIKSLRMLKWFHQNTPTSIIYIKTDDDIYLNSKNLIKYLEETYYVWSISDFIAGYSSNNFEVQKQQGEDKNETDWNYLEGFFYMLTGSTVPKLLKSSLVTPMVNIEGVYVTGILGHKQLGIELNHILYVYPSGKIQNSNHLSLEMEEMITEVIANQCGDDEMLFKMLHQHED